GECYNDANLALCQKWLPRLSADRPHIAGNAAKVPILDLYGGADGTITPDLATCVFDRLRADGANLTVCLDPTAGHGTIVGRKADYVNDWIAAVATGAAAPAACAANDSALVDDAGAKYACNPLLP